MHVCPAVGSEVTEIESIPVSVFPNSFANLQLVLSQHFQPDRPSSEQHTHAAHTLCSRFTTAAERRRRHTERADKRHSVLSGWGGDYASSAELRGEDRTSDGRPANSGRTPSRPPPHHPPPPVGRGVMRGARTGRANEAVKKFYSLVPGC